MDIKSYIESGKAVLGIELGSTRIKAVLIGMDNSPIASGSHDWENSYENGIWTYSVEDVWSGVQDCYARMATEVMDKYDIKIKKLGAIGFSGMMHGYMVFDDNANILTPFRTWRNTFTEKASTELTSLFNFNIPQRWSIAHLYQAILNNEEHLGQIKYLTTLAGYIHWQLTGKKVLGIGEASGVFPIDSTIMDYDSSMVDKFDNLIAPKNLPWKLRDILPQVLIAGDDAGILTEKGAKLLDPSGTLLPGIPLCPPEGDAGTGMTATNTVAQRTGNVSAGTSVFAMIVLEKALSKAYPEIDLVTTPVGDPVAMVHSNNCTSDINAWVNIFREFASAIGVDISTPELFNTLFFKAEEGDADCGGLLSYCYFSGEHVTGFEEGRPLFARTPDSKFNLANFMRTHLYSSVAALKVGLDILFNEEGIGADRILGHGGLFKTERVGQSVLSAAMNTPVSVMETAGEGGAWGIALLASYMLNKTNEETLSEYLDSKVFAGNNGVSIAPSQKDVDGFNAFIERYKKGLSIERAAVETL